MIDNATSAATYNIHRCGGGVGPESCACYCHCPCLCVCPIWDPDSQQPNMSGPLGSIAGTLSHLAHAWHLMGG